MSRIMKKVLIAGLAIGIQVAPLQAAEFGLFGDISYNDSGIDGENGAFALGGLDFYATQTISSTTRGFVEFVLESTEEGIVTDLERLWIARTFSDEVTMSAGRFHTPLGNWNRTYHHGALLQDTVSRPFFLDFEDGNSGILPVHTVGMMASGDILLNAAEISYELMLGNGPSIDTSGAGFAAGPGNKPEIDINNISDPNGDKSIVLRVIYKPDAVPIKTGVFMMNNTIAESSDGGGSAVANTGEDLVTQTILGFDIAYERDAFDVSVEYYSLNNKDEVGTAGSNTGTAYFVQAGYWLTDSIKAVLRYEDLSFDASDTYFQLLGTEQATHNVLALRYDVDESNSLKFEINKADMDVSEDTTSYSLQWAFLIP